jgi:hypothetical protein|nr:MAG TPA: hypothetical protein [Caudoviricetes sp.]
MKHNNNKHRRMAQAIDGFSEYLPTGNIKKDLIDPILQGVDQEEQLQYLADYVWYMMNQDGNPEKLKTKGIYGKPEYYPEGNWNKRYLRIDILGEDSQLYYYIKDRIKNFLNMIHEYNLLNTLSEYTSIFKEIYMADEYTDKHYKIDLIAIDHEDTEWYISVYKSDDSKAISKLNTDLAKSIENRLIYNVNRSGSPKNPENIIKWEQQILNNKKHVLWYDTSSSQWLFS